MNPINDIVCNLLETPFSSWKEKDKRDLLRQGRPTIGLRVVAKKDLKNRGRSYNLKCKVSWFTSYKWLCSSPVLQKLFCWPCLLFSNKVSLWSKEGFVDLLNINRSLHKHGDSKDHLSCALILNFELNQNNIEDALRENARLYKVQFNEKVRLNRLIFQRIIKAALYLSQQELEFFGHDESSFSPNRGNFEELLAVLISTSPVEIINHYEKIKTIFDVDSKTIQNDLIHCISDYIDDHIKSEINDTDFFSIQVDDITDFTQTSQCSLIIRYVDPRGTVVERFLGFHDVSPDRTSAALYNTMDKILQQFQFDHKLIGQCYDGASVMSGHLNGLQQQVKERAPQAVFVHCLAHQLSLVLQQSLNSIFQCRHFFGSLSGIPSFFHHCVKRFSLNSSIAKRVLSITETQWSSNSKLVNVIVEHWKELKEAFEFLIGSKESDTKSIQLARCFLHEFNSFEFTFLAVVFNDFFRSTDILFEVLQKKSLDIDFCVSQIKNTCEIFNNKRNDQFFMSLFEKAKEMMHIEQPKREYVSLTNKASSTEFKILFYEILDHVIREIDIRFQDCDKLQFVSLADTTQFRQYNSYFPSNLLESLDQFYGKIFSRQQRLKNELSLIYANESYRDISTQQLLQKLSENKEVFTEAYKLFCLVLTIPSASASVERHFSCLNRIKTYLGNKVSQERLSALANISIQKDLVQDLLKRQPFYEDITDKFSLLEDRRIDLVYKN